MKKLVKKPVKVEKVVEVVTEEVDSVVDAEGGPVTLLGKNVYVSCASYAYSGTVTGVNDRFLELSDPSIVYETGPWTASAWKDAQRLPTDSITIFFSQVESVFAVKR